MQQGEKLQKVLSMAGLGSRREMERWIEIGCVKVNDKQAQIGVRVTSRDKLTVKGKLVKNPLKRNQRTRVIMMHKPQGVICTQSDPENRKTVFDIIKKKYDPKRWYLVGRLDFNTSGLLLFTNNGTLAHRLMHPSFEIEREYAVRVLGEVSPEAQKKMLAGVTLDDGTQAKFDSLMAKQSEGVNHWYHVTLHEGKNREVRRLFDSQGYTVSRLTRVRYGDLLLPKYLGRGQFKELAGPDIKRLCASVKLEDTTE